MKPLIATLTIIFSVFLCICTDGSGKKFLQTDIAKVISDYPNGFKNISGEQLIETPHRQNLKVATK